jgi:hypothetical protein
VQTNVGKKRKSDRVGEGGGGQFFLPQAAKKKKKKKGMEMVVLPPQKFVLPNWYGYAVRLFSFPAQTQQPHKEAARQ